MNTPLSIISDSLAIIIIITIIEMLNAFQPGLGACGASLSSPGRLVLSDLIGARNGQMMNDSLLAGT